MPIRQNIAGDDCIDQYESAGNEQYEAGFSLLAAGYAVGVQNMGYAAEMFLKAVYFHLAGLGRSTPITRSHLSSVRADASALGVTNSPEAFHSVLFWANLIAAKRRNLVPPGPLSVTMESDLQDAVRKIYQNVAVAERYRSLQSAASVADMTDVFEGIAWIAEHFDQMKR